MVHQAAVHGYPLPCCKPDEHLLECRFTRTFSPLMPHKPFLRLVLSGIDITTIGEALPPLLDVFNRWQEPCALPYQRPYLLQRPFPVHQLARELLRSQLLVLR